MDFTKVLHLSQPVKDFESIRLTRAQVEIILDSAQFTHIPERIRSFFHISVIRSERVVVDEEWRRDIPKAAEKELSAKGPIFFVFSVKDDVMDQEAAYLYTGMMMANMQLQTTEILLGFAYSPETEMIKMFNTPEWKNRLSIPHDYSPIQVLKVGYSKEAANERSAYLSDVLSRIVD